MKCCIFQAKIGTHLAHLRIPLSLGRLVHGAFCNSSIFSNIRGLMETVKGTSSDGTASLEANGNPESGSGDATAIAADNVLVEGSAKIVFTGPSSAFYNPVQEFNRDLTITVLQQFSEDYRKSFERGKTDDDNDEPLAKKAKQIQLEEDGAIRILDALSASGLRAIRFAKEVPHISKVLANDFSEQAVETIKKNIIVNEVQHIVESRFGDAVSAMMEHRSLDKRFHAIDLDPYGSASIFLDSAVQAVADRGILMVTCTDMAVLCGNTPEACYNKYGSVALRHKCCHEFAIRVLLKSIDSHANRYARYIEPLLSISVDFYVRVFVRIHTGAKQAKDCVTKVSYVLACTGCHSLQLQPLARKTTAAASVKFTPSVLNASILGAGGKCIYCDQSIHIAGPIYSDPIHDLAFVRKLIESKCDFRLKACPENKRLRTHDRLIGVLSVVSEILANAMLAACFSSGVTKRLLRELDMIPVSYGKCDFRLKACPENKKLRTHDRLIGVLSVVSEELPDVPLYYEHDQLMHIVKSPVPRVLNIRSAILNAGFRCSIAHCNPRALKTDAPMSLLWDIARTVLVQQKEEEAFEPVYW
uniref:tRNA (guanine(26)-N(2))-dimethyltransferase n=1 Tax=Ascaris lumbricoides TaxID=6252 RepID=A0A9J2Q936_ASCLU